MPSGSPLAQAASRINRNLRLAAFGFLAVQLLVFGGLLIQGCKHGGKPIMSTELEPGHADPAVVTNTPAPANPSPATNTSVLGRPTHLRTGAEPTPSPPEAPSAPKEYRVVKGDCLSRIARAHRTTVKALRVVNRLKSERLLAGQKLTFVATGREAGGALEAVRRLFEHRFQEEAYASRLRSMTTRDKPSTAFVPKPQSAP